MADEPRNETPEEMSDEEMEDVVGGTGAGDQVDNPPPRRNYGIGYWG